MGKQIFRGVVWAQTTIETTFRACLCFLLKTPCGVPPPPPEFWLGVSGRLARFFDQRFLVRCVVVCFVFRQVLGGSRRFLAVLGGAWALAGRKWEPKIDKTEARGGKN